MWGDPRILEQILRTGRRRIRDPRVRRIYERAAVQTGLVESGGRNLSGGDADSAGWRQERRSLYSNPTNVKASVRRFADEFLQHYDPGEKSYQVAAQIQRPRADLRGRYHDEARAAASILRGQGGGGSDGPALLAAAGGGGAQGVPQGSEGLVPLLEALGQQKPQVQSGGLQAPAVSAAPTLPAGLQTPVSGGGPAPKPDVSALLEAVKTLGGDVGSVSPGGSVGGGGGSSSSSTGNALVASVKAEADHINQAHVPYVWGGGHGKKQSAGSKVTPLDCSGAVSRVLGVDPRVSGDFEKWGKPGRGRVTVYANKTHVLMEIDGHFWGTSKSNPGGGAGWIPRGQISAAYLRKFKARHA